MNLQHVFGNAIKQEKMNLQRFLGIAVVLLLAVVAILTARLGIATSNVVSTGRDLSDYALRHPDARVVIPSAPDLSDYALRHPDARVAIPSVPDLSDYALRHPDARVVVPSVPDLSDYALRHPELWTPSEGVALSPTFP